LNAAGNLKPSSRPKPGPKEIHRAYILLGSNIDPAKNLPKAVEFLQQQVDIEEFSNVMETPPVGTRGVNFLNAAVRVRTPLSSGLLKSLVLRPIEARMGRVRTFNKYAPRTIDLDIVIFDGRLLESKLWTHAFVAMPVSELAPDFTHPETGENLRDAAARLASQTHIRIRPDVALRPPAAAS
jgi:2-amino-4-hydroxy-6-hydroxymethyldihydropteridine diphosphokinase